jgi:hypothetical protein
MNIDLCSRCGKKKSHRDLVKYYERIAVHDGLIIEEREYVCLECLVSGGLREPGPPGETKERRDRSTTPNARPLAPPHTKEK